MKAFAVIFLVFAGYMFYCTATINDLVYLLTLKAGIGSLLAGIACLGIDKKK